MDDIRADLREIKSEIKALVVQAVEHNVILREHEARSIALQKQNEVLALQLDPIKKHVFFVDIILKAMGGIASALTIASLVKFLIGK
jgi:hypothetical protein